MRKFTNHILLWVVALSILNTSIDVIENRAFTGTGSNGKAGPPPDYDEIESIIEFVISESSDDAPIIPDNDNNDQQTVLKKAIAFDFSMPVRKLSLLNPYLFAQGHLPEAVYEQHALPAGFDNIFSPPPDQF